MAKKVWCMLTQPRKPGLKVLPKKSDRLSLPQPGITSQSTLSHKSSQSGNGHFVIYSSIFTCNIKDMVF